MSLAPRLSTRRYPHLLWVPAPAEDLDRLLVTIARIAIEYRSISTARAQQQTNRTPLRLSTDRTYRRTDGRTDTRPLHKPIGCYTHTAYYVGSVEKRHICAVSAFPHQSIKWQARGITNGSTRGTVSPRAHQARGEKQRRQNIYLLFIYFYQTSEHQKWVWVFNEWAKSSQSQ